MSGDRRIFILRPKIAAEGNTAHHSEIISRSARFFPKGSEKFFQRMSRNYGVIRRRLFVVPDVSDIPGRTGPFIKLPGKESVGNGNPILSDALFITSKKKRHSVRLPNRI